MQRFTRGGPAVEGQRASGQADLVGDALEQGDEEMRSGTDEAGLTVEPAQRIDLAFRNAAHGGGPSPARQTSMIHSNGADIFPIPA